MTAVDPRAGDESVLRRAIEKIVAERLPAGSRVTGFMRQPIRHIGSYDCEIVSTAISNGDTFDIFFKDYRFTRQSKDDPRLRRERERYVYRSLLRDADLGTPDYYGSVWGDEGRYWIFLEYVRGLPVEAPAGKAAVLAGAWLADLQHRFREQINELTQSDDLISMDADFYRSRAQDALRDTERIAPSATARLRAVARRYESAVELLVRQPRTLTHGGFIPWHVLIDASKEPARVCAIDWELAAIGPSLYDLALFTDDATPMEEARIVQGYLSAARRFGLPASEPVERVIGCIRLHRILDWLSRAREKDFSADKVEALVTRAELLSARVL